jgi:NCAIR mutase (PurE)-related protein
MWESQASTTSSIGEKLFQARVLIVVAGMEGHSPVLSVASSISRSSPCPPASAMAPASGIAALLTMLNSCAAGVATVNIDNGFGAGYSP